MSKCRPPFRLIAVLLALGSAAVQAQNRYPAAYTSPVDGAPMRLLAGGTFTIGSDKQDRRHLIVDVLKLAYVDVFDDDLSLREVTLPDLYIDKYEVTNARYAKYVTSAHGKPSKFNKYPQFNGPNQPVTGITWNDANAYCAWAGKRLPTEIEWERAARGMNGAVWPWGDAPEAGRFNGKSKSLYAPANVGSFPKGDTPEGVSDLAGNVWELTASVRKDGYHTMKGGSFLNNLAYVRGALRWATGHERNGAEFLGFRCIVDAKQTAQR